MRSKVYLLLLLVSMNAVAQTKIVVNVSNQSDNPRTDHPIIIPLQKYGEISSALVEEYANSDSSATKEVACQLDDLNLDDINDELCFLSDLKAHQQKKYIITLYHEGTPRNYPARVYTEMLMRNDKVKEKNRHNNFIESITARGDCANPYNLQHHHGVCFESELNGIRVYFDKRQTLDIYGKKLHRLELQQTQFYTSAEQKQEYYGDDVLWVGNTFGLGAFRGWNGNEPTMIDPVKSRTQRIISYGPLRTIVEIIDRGWTIDPQQKPLNMVIRYTQYAGHRDTDVNIEFDRDASDYVFSTGIIDVKGSEEYSDHKGTRACWGTDWPASDTINWNRETVGLAINLPQQNIIEEKVRDPKGKQQQGCNYTFVIKANGTKLNYKVAYCSANEKEGFRSAKEWFDWVKAWKKETDTPVIVNY